MPNKLKFRVETETIPAPYLGRLLMAFNALHVAAALTSEYGGELAEQLNSSGTIKMVNELLSGPLDDSKLFRALAALNTRAIGRWALPLHLSELHSGSIEGVIEELIESIFGRFKALLSTLPGIAKTGNIDDLSDLVQEMKTSASDGAAFEAIVQVATFNARLALNSMQATTVTVSEKAVQYNTIGA